MRPIPRCASEQTTIEIPNTRPARAAPVAMRVMLLDVRIARRLGHSARMGQCAVARWSDLLGVFPQVTGSEFGSARLPILRAPIELSLAELDVERAALRIERDDVTVAHERDRAANRRLRTDMADAKAARGAGKTAIGNQRDLGAHALPIKSGRGRQHFAHAGSALGTLVADDEHVAFGVLPVLHRLEASLFAVKATRRTGELQSLHTRHFHDGTFGREIAFQ